MAGSPAHAGVVAAATINHELPWVFDKNAANSERVEYLGGPFARNITDHKCVTHLLTTSCYLCSETNLFSSILSGSIAGDMIPAVSLVPRSTPG